MSFNCLEIIGDRKRVKVEKADFWDIKKLQPRYDIFEIDLLHIDIANNGDTYKFAMEEWLLKVAPTGMMILEGGSEERDNVCWMKQFDKTPINPFLQKIKEENDKLIDIKVIEKFPSLTIIR